MTTIEAPTIRCTECSADKAVAGRLPRGWKRVGERILCDRCNGEQFALRAVTMRVASPDGIGWPELRALLKDQFTATTQASNWVLRQMAMHDPGIDPATGKMQKNKLREDHATHFDGKA